jgi:hypothetical protein
MAAMMDNADRPGQTKGGVSINNQQKPSTPVVGQDPFLVHPNIAVDGAFASGDNSGGAE